MSMKTFYGPELNKKGGYAISEKSAKVLHIGKNLVEIEVYDTEAFEILLSTQLWSSEKKDATPNVETITNAVEQQRFIAERDGATTATKEAPWVGAEKKWRVGKPSPPTIPAGQMQPRLAASQDQIEELTLTEAEWQTVLSSLPPAQPVRRINWYGGLSYLAYSLIFFIAVAIIFGAAVYQERIVDYVDNRALPAATQSIQYLSALSSGSSAAEASNELSLGIIPSAMVSKLTPQIGLYHQEGLLLLLRNGKDASVGNKRMKQDQEFVLSKNDVSKKRKSKARRARNASSLAYRETETSQLPVLPSKEKIHQTMGRIVPAVRACNKHGHSKKLIVKMVVSGKTGKVISSGTLDEVYRDTQVGHCAARAMKALKFPLFQQDRLTIKYPFKI